MIGKTVKGSSEAEGVVIVSFCFAAVARLVPKQRFTEDAGITF